VGWPGGGACPFIVAGGAPGRLSPGGNDRREVVESSEERRRRGGKEKDLIGGAHMSVRGERGGESTKGATRRVDQIN
jgi:hypothetical protein